jgi:hypothetical protein
MLSWTNAASQSMHVADDGAGTLYLFQDGVQQAGNAGTVNYDTGEIILVNFNPYLPSTQTLNVYADPATYDIETVKNNILLKGDVTVNVERVNV